MTRYRGIARSINGLRTPRDSTQLHATIYFPLRREGRDAPAALYARVPFCLRKSHARPRVQQAPGLPCALDFEEGQTKMQNSGGMRREIAASYSVVIVRLVRNCALGRTIQYSRDDNDRTDRPRRTGSPACAGDDEIWQLRRGELPRSFPSLEEAAGRPS